MLRFHDQADKLSVIFAAINVPTLPQSTKYSSPSFHGEDTKRISESLDIFKTHPSSVISASQSKALEGAQVFTMLLI